MSNVFCVNTTSQYFTKITPFMTEDLILVNWSYLVIVRRVVLLCGGWSTTDVSIETRREIQPTPLTTAITKDNLSTYNHYKKRELGPVYVLPL